MKRLLTIFLILFTLTATAQQRRGNAKEKCVITKIEHLESHKVKVTTTNRCTKVIVIKTYLKKEWEKLVAQREKRAKERRKKKQN